ncbi:MAG: M20/M25/M40 family metallo-hydrolase [Holophagaceae bacterium]|nr:M20/M25/M40 family metallo-hydrolase [Holophagaceae bacterium]
MFQLRRLFALGILFSLSSVIVATPQEDPNLAKIIEIGTKDPQVMTWDDILANRFGGRYTGSDAYINASDWAVWQFQQWGLKAWKEEVGTMPVGFNRGPWFGKMTKPFEKTLFFATPSLTSGTKGTQIGHVVIAPEKVEDVEGMKDKIKGAWLLWPGKSEGFARDGRKATVISPLVQACINAGALGTIQAAGEPFRAMDGSVTSWENLPVLPDIKLEEKQYNEIKALVEKNEIVELQFDIRNHFKMGPVPYYNVIAVLEGREFPDEFVVLGGHLDSFDAGTGAIDDGNGVSSAMEAVRLIAQSGIKPRRSVMVVLFAAEEMGLWGSIDVVKKHPEWNEKIALISARDGSPHAITGAAVPPDWYDDFARFTAPLIKLNPKFPFTLEKNEFPAVRPENPGGTDATVYMQAGIPSLMSAGPRNPLNNHNYQHIWHTVYDTYDNIVPFADHQQHAAICQAVIAYGVAELPHLLNRKSFYLSDGIYADINLGTMEAPKRVMVRLDTDGAPEQVSHFLAAVETRGGGQFGRGARGGQPPAQSTPPLAEISSARSGFLEAKLKTTMEFSAKLPRVANKNLKSAKGLLGFAPEGFVVVARPNTAVPSKYSPIGSIIAVTGGLEALKPSDPIRSLRIIRVGERAKEFKAAVADK